MSSVIKTKAEEIAAYLSDSSVMRGGYCLGVCVPKTVEELETFVRKCFDKKEHITISGAGTGTVGGRVPMGGWVISMEKLSRMGEIEKMGEGVAYLQVDSGVRLKDIQDKVAAEGYFYPPNPTETSSFMGGNVATNASGTRSFKYGSTRSYVDALDVMMGDGGMAQLRRGQVVVSDVFTLSTNTGSISGRLPEYDVPDLKYAMGYWVRHPMDLVDLFVGSEGTLGIVTGVRLKLLKAPKSFLGGLFFFKSFEAAHALVKHIQQLRRQSMLGYGNYPCSVEYYDFHSLKMMREGLPDISPEAKAALYLEEEIWLEDDEVLEQWLDYYQKFEVIESGSFIANDSTKQRKLIDFRHHLPARLSEYYIRHHMQKISTDFALPEGCFAQFQKFYEALLEREGVQYVAFGHIGDCNLHINLLPKSLVEQEKCASLYAELMRSVVKMGGVIAAEHGIGKVKRQWLNLQFSETQLAQMRTLKRAFDPHLLLNPGTLFPL